MLSSNAKKKNKFLHVNLHALGIGPETDYMRLTLHCSAAIHAQQKHLQ
jgi:hypothetical protein